LLLTRPRFDLVCNSQHGTVERPFEWWQTTFRDSIAAIGRVALVLAPWDDPIPLTRCWCLFEIFTAVASGEEEVELQVRLPGSQRLAFVKALAADFDVVMATLVRVESQRAEAFLATDQERIHAAIKSSAGGHAKLDALVKDQLRAWLLRETLAAAAAAAKTPDGSLLPKRQQTFTTMLQLLQTRLGSTLKRWSTTKRRW
jgi:hypothetical protein